MGETGRLTAKQRAAVQALATSRTVGEAMRACGVPESTLNRWRKKPEFAAALREAERELWRDGLRLLLADQALNLASMMQLRQSGDSDPVRLKAAAHLESALQRRFTGLTLEELEERIAALETGDAGN